MFYGIIIRMYFSPGEHNPPHFHAYYNEFKASFAIETFDIIEGSLPRKQQRLVVTVHGVFKQTASPLSNNAFLEV